MSKSGKIFLKIATIHKINMQKINLVTMAVFTINLLDPPPFINTTKPYAPCWLVDWFDVYAWEYFTHLRVLQLSVKDCKHETFTHIFCVPYLFDTGSRGGVRVIWYFGCVCVLFYTKIRPNFVLSLWWTVNLGLYSFQCYPCK